MRLEGRRSAHMFFRFRNYPGQAMLLISRSNSVAEERSIHARYGQVVWMLPLCMFLVSFAATYHPHAWEFLHFDREAILDGELHRLLTFHFVHLSNAHFLINIVTLAVLWLLYGRALRGREWIVATIGSGGAIGLFLLLLRPEIGWAAGLSGLLYALLACASIRSALSGEFWSWAIVVLLIVKIVLEQTTGPSVAVERLIVSPVLVEAHTIGVIGGCLLGVVLKMAYGPAKLSRRRALETVTDSRDSGSTL